MLTIETTTKTTRKFFQVLLINFKCSRRYPQAALCNMNDESKAL